MEGTQGCALWINQLLCGGCESPRAAASLYRPGAAPCSKSLDLPGMPPSPGCLCGERRGLAAPRRAPGSDASLTLVS